MAPRMQPNMRRQGRVTPDPMTEDAYLSEAPARTGTYTATETGARSLAVKRNRYQQQRDIMNSAVDSTPFEKLIRSGKGFRQRGS